MTQPRIRYARRGDVYIAYTVEGSGPVEAMVMPNWFTDVESISETTVLGGRIFHRIAEFSRVVNFDQPGTGQSDPIQGPLPTLEEFADSALTIMDTVGMARAAVLTWDVGAPAAIMFAAAHAERVSHLVLFAGSARLLADEGYTGIPPKHAPKIIDSLVAMWGTPEYAAFLAPSASGNEEACEAMARWLRHALSPGAVRRMFEMVFGFDVRPLLPLVQVPTLIIHPTRSIAAGPVSQAEFLAATIPNARLHTFDSEDMLPYREADFESVMSIVEQFITGDPSVRSVDERVLATVLFTDVVGSTERAAQIGDRAWRNLLIRHDAIVRRTVERFRGRVVSFAGDGVMATFDGPARAIKAAVELRDALRKLGLETRAGLHTGEVEPAGAEIRGLAVHIAARVSALAGAGEVLVSSTVKDLVIGSGIHFEDHGMHQLKGVPDVWRIYAACR